MPTETAAAACVDVVQIYRSLGGGVAALRGLDARFPAGTVTVVAGPSGAGKSTLLRLLACFEPPAAGDVLIGGRSTARLSARQRRKMVARHIGYVFQRPAENLIDYLTVAQHLRLAWRMRDPTGSVVIDGLLGATNLSAVATRRPDQLSAGEQQRLAVAMAVAGAPALVVADEPTAELDSRGARQLATTIYQLAATGQTFVVSSHDPVLIRSADQLLLMRSGALAAVRDGDGPVLAAVDPGGRVQIPADLLDRFPDGRATVLTASDGIVFRRP